MPVPRHHLLLTLWLTGCAVSAEEYPARLAEAECSLYEDCDLLAAFDGTFETCVSILQEQEQERVSADSCGYSGRAAHDCLRQLDTSTCDDLRDAAQERESPCEMVCEGS